MVTTRSQTLSSKRRRTLTSHSLASVAVSEELQAHEPVHIRTKLSGHRPANLPQPPGLSFQLQPASYGLIQERIHTSVYALVVQAILWNQTYGLTARPILFHVLTVYPTPLSLSQAHPKELIAMLRPIGLQNIRALRLIALGQAWVRAPPCKERRYRKLHYPLRGCGMEIKPGEILGMEDERQGWEIAHLPGIGAYALDSFRIFYRDRLREVDGTGETEPEWKRVVPKDKDLKAYLKWRWAEDGWDWNETTGEHTKLQTV